MHKVASHVVRNAHQHAQRNGGNAAKALMTAAAPVVATGGVALAHGGAAATVATVVGTGTAILTAPVTGPIIAGAAIGGAIGLGIKALFD